LSRLRGEARTAITKTDRNDASGALLPSHETAPASERATQLP
jgi:hypothetical protein